MFCSAILHVAEHLSGQQPSPPAYATIEDIWAAVYNVLALISPSSAGQCVTPSMSLDERQTCQTALLSVLLSYAVSDGCRDRKTHLGMIRSLPLDTQQCLTTVVDQNRSFLSKTPLGSRMSDASEVASIGSARSRDDAMTSPSGFTPARKKKSFVDRISTEGIFSPGTLDPAFESRVEGLKTQNQSIRQELANSTMREAELAVQMQELETKVRRNMMKIEAESLRASDEAHDAHQKELAGLREELCLLQIGHVKEQKAQRELIKIRDEMDLMEHSKEKLAETEEKLRKCHERLEQLAEVKDSMKREEEAHSASVEECLRLENEMKSLQPLRRQLEEYKARAVEGEFQLVECREDLKQMTEMIRHLNSAHGDLTGGARSFQEEAETLDKRLSEDEEIDCDGPALGEGISQLNLQVNVELLRLRNENVQLKDFAAKRGTDSVQRLEEKLDDIQRLSDCFKEQYLSTKKELKSTFIELEETQKREEDLKEKVAEWIAKWEDMDKQVKILQDKVDLTKEDLEKTITLLEESKQRDEGLRNEVAYVSSQNQEIQAESEERLVEGNKTKDELAGTLELFVNSQDREKNLHCELKEMEDKMQEEQQRSAAFENELNLTSDEFENTKTELNATIDRENGLRGELADLIEVKDNFGKELEDEKQAREGDRVTAERMLNGTRERLEELAKNELEGLQTNMNLLLEDERVAFRKKQDKTAGEYQELHDKTTHEYAELKRTMTNGLDAAQTDFEARIIHLKNEYTSEIESIKKQAEQDREKLLAKGKAMLKDSKEKAEEILRQLEDKLDDTKQTLSRIRKDTDEFEHKTRAKVSSYKHKLHYSTVRVNELGDKNEQLSDCIRGLEKEKSKVLEENERYRRQLGGQCGAGGKTQNQMDMLQNEFNAVLEENRALKKELASSGSVGALGAISEGREAGFGESIGKPDAQGGVSGSTLSALREEYEEQFKALNDEKRELVMKNSAAITDVQKAEQRSWELEKELEKLKQEVSSAHLALQRAELQMEDSGMETSAINEQSFHSAKEEVYQEYSRDFLLGPSDEVDQENAAPLLDLSVLVPSPLLDLSVLVPSPPATPQSVLSPSNRQNVSILKRSVSFGIDRTKSSPADILNASMSSEGPTLMELTQQSANAQDSQPECKQS